MEKASLFCYVILMCHAFFIIFVYVSETWTLKLHSHLTLWINNLQQCSEDGMVPQWVVSVIPIGPQLRALEFLLHVLHVSILVSFGFSNCFPPLKNITLFCSWAQPKGIRSTIQRLQSLNSDNATATHGWEFKRAILAMLSGWKGYHTLFLLSITMTLANRWHLWTHECGRGQVAVLERYHILMLNCT